MGVATTFPVEQNIPALMSNGSSESSEGRLDVAQNMLHLRKLRAVVNFRTNHSGHYAAGAAAFAAETPRRPSTEKVA